MSLSRTVSEINGDFCRKSQIFSPRVFCAPAEGFPLELGTSACLKLDDTFSRVDTIHQRDGQADGHRATAKTALTHSVAR